MLCQVILGEVQGYVSDTVWSSLHQTIYSLVLVVFLFKDTLFNTQF